MISSARSVGSCWRSISSGLGEDVAAGRLEHLVEPDHQALVLVGLDLDQALVGAELDALVDHLVPGLRRLRDPVGAVPEQLGVRPQRRRVELALELGRLDDAREDVLRSPRRRRPAGTARSSRRWRTRRSRSRPSRSGRPTSPRRRAGGRAARAGRRRRRAGTRTRCCRRRSTPSTHLSAAACGEPLGSLKMNQVSVWLPEPDSSSPHADSRARARRRQREHRAPSSGG